MTQRSSSTPRLNPQLAAFAPELIVFDKDGTLIDFQAMWAGWVTELAQQLETAAGVPITNQLFKAIGFEPGTEWIDPDGELAVTPMAGLHALTSGVLRTVGLSPQAAKAVMAIVWHLPDPIALARPLTDLALLFSTLRLHGVKIAVATSDNHAATETMLAALGIASLVDAVICADDGVPVKPATDMVLTVCDQLNVPCAKTVVIGDNVPDLQMGRTAGVGLVIGVLSGVGSEDMLAPHADMLLPNIGNLLQQ
jgi:phosphoglycolate phosphatase